MRKDINGITLIALVITIIVLIILAGVSIAMLTGQNGILTQAQNAKKLTENKSAEEKVKLAVMGARTKSNTASLELEKLKEEITNQGGTATNNEFPLNVTMDEKNFTIGNTGAVTAIENGTLGIVTGSETSNTTVKDSLGNQVVVPAGFKVINPNDNVTNGIVIEDVSHSATAGSQFVWIPVGEVIKDSNGNKEKIALSRYAFYQDKNEMDKGAEVIGNYFTEDTLENHDKNCENIITQSIENFKSKAINNNGYYIGRYEARTDSKREEQTDSNQLTRVTVKPDEYVYNWISQPQAATLSKEMYDNSNFKSELINSYAWDTAIVFLQKFDSRKDKIDTYSLQNSLNNLSDGLASKGTNNLEDTSKQDVICNVWDMASNCLEWTTETYNDNRSPCTSRGGFYLKSDFCTSIRNNSSTTSKNAYFSFRPILYL